MWVEPTASQALSVLGMLKDLRQDCSLVPLHGEGVQVPSLLLALHSPLMAQLLEEQDRHGSAISLPFRITVLKELVNIMYGGARGYNPEVEEAATFLGIVNTGESNYKFENIELSELKIEEISNQSSDYGGEDIVNFSSENNHKSTKSKRKVPETSSDEVLIKHENNLNSTDSKTEYLQLKRGASNLSQLDNKNKVKRKQKHRGKKGNTSSVFDCEVCGVEKKTTCALKNHIESEHKESVPCPKCGMIYKTQAIVNRHILRVHSEKERFKCSQCDYRTNISWDVKAHYERNHTDTYLNPCEFCGNIFKDLKRHSCLAKGRIPCTKCDKTFPHTNEMKLHIKRIHENVKNKACEQCSYRTYSGFNLRLHVKKMHNSKL